MELFKSLNEILSEGEDFTLVARKKGDKMIVSVLVTDSGINSDAVKIIPPFVLKGSAEELDGAFVAAINSPIADMVGIHTSIKEFDAAKKEAIKKVEAEKKPAAKPEPIPVPTAKAEAAKKKAEAARKKEEAAAKAAAEQGAEDDEILFTDELEAKQKAEAAKAAAEPQQEPAPEPEPEPQPAPAPTPAPVKAPEPEPEPTTAPASPEVQDDIKDDIRALYKRGTSLFKEGKYEKAVRDFERCRELAKPNQYEQIDKAITMCNKKIDEQLFNAQN